MLNIHQLSKSFGPDILLEQISFTVKSNQRLGLVGPNGCGKTTLLRIIMGELQPDRGTVQRIPTNLRIGYLKQGLKIDDSSSIEDFINQKNVGLTEDVYQQLEDISAQLSKSPDNPQLIQSYDALLQLVSQNTSSTIPSQEVLGRLKLDHLPANTPLSKLSGGQKTRLALAQILLTQPQCLILDEPTNHLDINMIEWLESWVLSFQGPMLVVSHDRKFLDMIATGILEIDPLTHKLNQFVGGYSTYLNTKKAQEAQHWQEYVDQQDEIARLKNASTHVREIARFHKGGKADTGDKFARGFFANRGLATIRRAKVIEARIDQILNEEKIEKPGRTWGLKIDFQEPQNSSRRVLSLSDGTIGYPDRVVKSGVNFTVQYGERVILSGPNGCGKSTLLKTIAGEIPLLSGDIYVAPKVNFGFMKQEQENLSPENNALELLTLDTSWSQTDMRSFLHKFLFSADDVFLPVKMMSFGERARLSLALLVARGCNLLLLDEPINHLDIASRTQFEDALLEFEGSIIAVAHDRYFIDKIATQVWEFTDFGFARIR